jgi:hypothetical protein
MTDPANPALVENLLLMCNDDFSELLSLAAERGVRVVLAGLGLYPRDLPEGFTTGIF